MLEKLASPRFDAALKARQRAAIAARFVHTPAQLQEHVEQETAEDACIPKHRFPDMPDPSPQGQQSLPAGINPTSPQFEKAEAACAYLNP